MTATIALPRQPHSDWLARLRTIGLGLGGRNTVALGLARQTVRSATPWWTTSTLAASSAVVVYQPARAASYEASLVDLTGNDNDVSFTLAASGVTIEEFRRPEWTFNDGWLMLTNPTNTTYSRCLFVKDGVYVQSNWTMFAVYSDVELISGQVQLCGLRTLNFYIWPCYASTFYFGHALRYDAGPAVLAGDAILAGASFGAVNGEQKVVNMSYVSTPLYQIGIGVLTQVGMNPNNTGGVFKNGKIKAFALWNRELTFQEYLDVRSQCYAAIS